ncbi:hypothetical protein V461_19805 [Pantoea ananatis BRT98]|nr:hypothetical protein V461_19805 [Pantoea ananatis BRT98]
MDHLPYCKLKQEKAYFDFILMEILQIQMKIIQEW